MKLLPLLLTVILIFVSSAPARAEGDLNTGIQALRARDYNTALINLQPLAIDGNPEASYRMCGMYYLGQGVPKNDAEAARFCHDAAEKGHPDAMYNLALMYQKGEGVGQDFNEAVRWYAASAAKGNENAKYNLKQIRLADNITNRNVKAAALVNNAETNLAAQQLPINPTQIPSNAQNTLPQPAPPRAPQPTTISLKSAKKAVAKVAATPVPPPPAPPVPPEPMGNVILANQIPEPLIATLAQIQPAQQQPVSAAFGNASTTAFAAAAPVAVKKSLANANIATATSSLVTNAPQKPDANLPPHDLKWFIAQANTGNAQAQNNLGVVYRRGLNGAQKNLPLAIKWFDRAASQGSINGMLNLASIYKLGDGVNQNLELAYAWYNLAVGRLPVDSPKRGKAQENVMEIAPHLSNEQIGDALQYVSQLEETIPVMDEPPDSAEDPTRQ